MSFDLLAPHYRWMEWVLAGDKLQRCRTAFLDRLASPRRVLIAGEGNGRFLAALLRRFPRAEVTCVDSSARMLALAAERLSRELPGPVRVDFQVADIRSWNPEPGAFDLVVCHFILDCFPAPDLERVVVRLKSASAQGAVWLLGDFCAPARGWRRWRAQAILWCMYRFFRVVTRLPAPALADPDPILQQAGLRLVDRRTAEWGLLHSDVWRLHP